jgi:hypothetical protein
MMMAVVYKVSVPRSATLQEVVRDVIRDSAVHAIDEHWRIYAVCVEISQSSEHLGSRALGSPSPSVMS